MTLKTHAQLSNTKGKLAALERRYEAAKQRPVTNPHVRSLTLRSLATTINQLKEEIALFEIRAAVK